MPTHADRLLCCVRRIAAQACPEPNDSELLDRFLCGGDPAAFEVLVDRHGPMVLRVCQHVLGNRHDAEDAFQATFLVLARKAGSVRPSGSLAGWLHGVAYHVALGARTAARRRRHEGLPPDLSPPDPRPDRLAELTARESLRILEEEVQRLPEAYRLPVVLCCLHGHSQEEVARQLGWTPGSVKGRLERGRQRLHRRLVGRGLGLATALAIVEFSRATEAGPARTLLASAALAAASVAPGNSAGTCLVSVEVKELAGGGLTHMVRAKGKLGFMLILAAGAVAVGLAASGRERPAENTPVVRAAAEPNRSAPEAEQPRSPKNKESSRTDQDGDPLPVHALRRLGTVRLRHAGPVTALTFLPADKVLASASFDGTIRLWDPATGKELRQVAKGQGWITHLALSPDGHTLASCSNERVVSVWEIATGKELLRLGPFPSVVRSTAFSPDGKILAGAFVGEKIVRFWDRKSGRELPEIKEPDGVIHLAFSPDGRTLAAGGLSSSVGLWEVATRKALRRIDGYSGAVTALAFSRDGNALAIAGRNDRAVLLREVATGKELRRLPAKLGPADYLAFSLDGRVLAAGFRSDSPPDDTLHLWDFTTGKELRRIKGASFGVGCLAFSRDGKTLATGGNDCSIRLWDVATGKERSPSTDGHLARILALAFAPDARTLASGGMDGVVCFWDPTTGKLRRRLNVEAGFVCRLAFSPDGTLLATAHSDETIRLWDVATMKERRRLKGYAGAYHPSLVFSPDGKTLAAAGAGETSRLWDVATGRELHRFAEQGRNAALAFLPDGKTLVSVSGDGQGLFDPRSMVRLQDVASGKELRHWVTPQRSVTTIAASPDGRRLALGGREYAVRVWDPVTGQDRREFHRPVPNSVSSASFSPDGRTLAWAFDGGQVSLWETSTGKERCRFEGSPSLNLVSVVFAPDGRTLATGGADGSVLLWDRSHRAEAVVTPALTADNLESLWERLGDVDAARADRAIWDLAGVRGPSGVAMLRKHLRPVARTKLELIKRLLTDLDDDRFAVRERATHELQRLEELAEPALRKGLAGRPTVEMRRRMVRLLELLDAPVTSPAQLRTLRALEALEYIGTTEARQLLKQLATGAANARLTQEAKAALERLARRSSAGR